MTTDVTYRGNVSDPGDNLTETITTNSTAGGGTLVNSFAYSYDANKNKLKETIGGPLNPYGFGTTVGQEAAYDAEDRLTDWHRDDTLRDLNYALSKVGNWNTFTVEGVTETRTHGNAHELTNLAGGANPGALTHDAKGNILTSPAHGSQTYTWDFDNQLKQAVSGGTHDYYYDALGRRVMKHVSDENKLIFVHDGQQIIAEYKYTNGVVQTPGPGVLEDASDSTSSQTQSNAAVIIGTRRGSATIQRKYVYSTYIDERCVMIDRTAKGALPAGTEELFYYHRNNLYSTAAMTDAAGLVQERYAYDAYGNILLFGPDTGGALGAPLTVSALGQPYTYTGRRLDDETENYHYRARYYQAPLGRFLGRDRILYGDGYNMYAYVSGRALVATDPSGLSRQVTFPEFGIVSYIAQFKVDDIYLEFFTGYLDYLAKNDEPRPEETALLARLSTALRGLAGSANYPTPPVSGLDQADTWRDFVDSKEYRSYSFHRPLLTCNDTLDHVQTWSSKNTWTSQGYTPIARTFGRGKVYEPGEGEAKIGASCGSKAGCVTITLHNKFRIGKPGRMLSVLLLKGDVPYGWTDLECTLCCNGSYTVKYRGSHFPSHYAYVDGTKVGQSTQKNLGVFTFSGAGKEAPGGQFHVESK